MALLLALLLLPQGAAPRADTSETGRPRAATPPARPARQASRRGKSPEQALWRSLGGTLVPIIVGTPLVAYGSRDAQAAGGLLVAAGAVLGPALGHAYAENHEQALTGMRLRGYVGSIPFVVAGLQSILGIFVLPFTKNDSSLSPLLLGLSGSVVAGSAAYDIATAPRAARQYGSSRKSRASVSLRPRFRLVSGQAGMTLSLRF